MGGEFAQYAEWSHEQSLDWHLLREPFHKGVQDMVRDINGLYRKHKALHLYDEKRDGFEWINECDYRHNCISFIRKTDNADEAVIVVCNFSNQELSRYRIGVPENGKYKEIFNSQSQYYGGCNVGNSGPLTAEAIHSDAREFSISMTLPPLGVLFLKKVT
jgi:1,4-alpha-glucan branching enzyme